MLSGSRVPGYIIVIKNQVMLSTNQTEIEGGAVHPPTPTPTPIRQY